MNEREVAELRRRFRQDRSGISHVRGCYVNENREIVSQFDQSLGVLTQEENEKLLTLLRRTLTGTLGKNLLDITFATQQVVHGAEHKRLMDLRASELRDEEAVAALFQAVIQSVSLEGNYMILLAHDAYDVPYRGKDGEEQEDASSEVFSYLICAICPVKLTKPALSYQVQEGVFCTKTADWVVAPPALGFLFPAFDDRSANIYDALYYTKDIQDVQEALVASVFGTPAPIPAAAQQESFRAVLGEALEEDCCLQVVQAVHDQLCGLMEDHKESRDPEPLTIGKGEVWMFGRIVLLLLLTCGMRLLAAEKLNQVSRLQQDKMEDDLDVRVSQIMREITGGKYTRLVVEEPLKMSVLMEDGRKVGIDRLSRGTIEQIYFALRMAAGELLYEEEYPVILDDTFAYYDEARLGNTLKWLAANRRQVLLFTCQKREEEILGELGIPYKRQKI